MFGVRSLVCSCFIGLVLFILEGYVMVKSKGWFMDNLRVYCIEGRRKVSLLCRIYVGLVVI